MRYPASEKLGIIRLVEQSHLPVRRALEKLSMPRPTLYHWCGRYRTGWPEVLKDRRPQPGRVWSRTLTMALGSSGLDGMNVAHRPRLLSDNGSSQSAGDLADWLEETGMDHGRGAPLHPQTQGKIERSYDRGSFNFEKAPGSAKEIRIHLKFDLKNINSLRTETVGRQTLSLCHLARRQISLSEN